MVTRVDVKQERALPRDVHLIGAVFGSEGAGGRYDHVNPATGQIQASFEMAGVAEVDRAVCAARSVCEQWRSVDANARRRMLLRVADLFVEHGDELGAVASLENGVPSVWTPMLAS